MIRLIDRFNDRITMYRLVLWYLVGLVGAALVYGLKRVAGTARFAAFIITN